MHILFRAGALGAALSLMSVGVASAAPVTPLQNDVSLNFTKVALSNGGTIYCRKAGGGQWEVFVMSNGKQVPAPPGSYKQLNGNVIVVGKNGMISPGSKIMLNPQPLPP
jgi:hypothetical protein